MDGLEVLGKGEARGKQGLRPAGERDPSRLAESMWDLRGSGFHGQESPRDSRPLGMKSSLVRCGVVGGRSKAEPTLNFVEMLGWLVEESRGTREMTQAA